MRKEKNAIFVSLLTGLLFFCSCTNLWDKLHSGYITGANISYKYFLYLENNSNGINGDIYKYEIDISTGSLSTVVPFGLSLESSYLAVSPSQKYVYSATKGGNGIYVYPINGTDGAFGIPTFWNLGNSPDGMILIHPNGNFLFGTSLAATRVFDAQIGSDGSLSPPNMSLYFSNSLLSAPKVFAIKPSGDFMFVADYNNNCVYYYTVNASTGVIGAPTTVVTGSTPQAIAIHPTLNYLYVACVTPDSIQSYSINATTGNLTVNGSTVGTNGGPNCLVIDPGGNYLYCVNSYYPSSISGYRINQTDGTLSILPGSPYFTTNSVVSAIYPQYIAIDPTGKYLYAPIYGVGFVEGYSIDPSAGVLTHLLPLSGWSYPDVNATNPVIAAIAQ